MEKMSYPVIIVLGNLMDSMGELNDESSSRMDLAIDVFHKNSSQFIITCGWDYRSDSNIAIADAMKSYAINNGHISPEVILTDVNSRDTVGDAIFSKKNIVTKKNLSNLLIITSDYHTLRTHKIFSYIYGKQYSIKVLGSKTPKGDDFLKSESESLKIFYKTFAGVKSGDDMLIYNRLREKHPFYNGHVYPKI